MNSLQELISTGGFATASRIQRRDPALRMQEAGPADLTGCDNVRKYNPDVTGREAHW